MALIKFRRGTSSLWATINPVLAEGELGFATDLNQFKIGDGVGSWNDLSYFVNESVLNDNYVLVRKSDGTPLNGKVVVITTTEDETDIDNIAVYDSLDEVGT